eukprot:TRINITY_DN9397_c0_g1_i1.p1 TRINITY_DN9397_c0_g1~~TRINITY_DN9397_c0_g1_i1.p1  ORF type:complete len:286 (-),score=57.14 TRINITY_DN9397_c0_g1_i1:366-1223(-)
MSATGSGYDLSVSTFSPEGRVFQVEYATKAVEKSGTVVGIRCKDGVVMGVEKFILSKMLVSGSNRRIFNVDTHCGMAIAGLVADAKALVNRTRSEARDYRNFYGHLIPGDVLDDRISGFVHTYTIYWWLRPFGCSVLLASYDNEGPQLHMIEPSGISYRYFGCAIGKHREAAKTELEKLKFDQITCRQAIVEIAKIIYKLHDDIKDKEFELELSWVCDESKKQHELVPAKLREEAVKIAMEAKRKSELDEDEEEEEKKEEKEEKKDTQTKPSSDTVMTDAPAKKQ